MSERVLRMRDVAVSLPGALQPLFEHLSLDLARGDLIGIVGPNGVGKTMLVNLLTLNDVVRPSSGSITFVDNASRPGRSEVARSFQNPPVVFGLTVWEFLSYGARVQARTPGATALSFLTVPFQQLMAGQRESAHSRASARQLLDELSLPVSMAEKRLEELSMGMRKIVDVLRAVLEARSLFVLDEPFANIRPELGERIATWIKSRTNAGAAGLVIDHKRTILGRCADRTYQMTPTGLLLL